jgi:hypothetical protein
MSKIEFEKHRILNFKNHKILNQYQKVNPTAGKNISWCFQNCTKNTFCERCWEKAAPFVSAKAGKKAK